MIDQAEETIREKWDAFDRRVQTYLKNHEELNIFLGRNMFERHTYE